MVLLCMAVGRLDISYPAKLPDDWSDILTDFFLK